MPLRRFAIDPLQTMLDDRVEEDVAVIEHVPTAWRPDCRERLPSESGQPPYSWWRYSPARPRGSPVRKPRAGGDLVVSKECSGFVNDPRTARSPRRVLMRSRSARRSSISTRLVLGPLRGVPSSSTRSAWEQQGVRHMLPRREPDALRVLRGNGEVHLVPRQRRGHGYGRGARPSCGGEFGRATQPPLRRARGQRCGPH